MSQADVLFVSHGGGPLPLLGDPGHREMVQCLTAMNGELRKPDAILVGGAAEPIRAFRTKNEALAAKENRAEMAKTISPLVHLRATGVAWCTADTGGCNGGQGVEKTRCADCGNAVIDESRKAVWQGIYAQQIELRDLTDIGPGGTERVERDLKRCEAVLKGLGATEEDLAYVAT